MQTTGKLGDTLLITGSGLYLISNIVFGGEISGAFTQLDNAVRITVPEFAAKGLIRIESAERGVTGYSSEIFVPEPKVTGFYPLTGLPNDIIRIEGRAFSGVTNVTFNNLNCSSFTVLSNSGIIATLPTGNTKGYITVFGQSGLSNYTQVEFVPSAYVTGLSIYSGHTGDSLNILGLNFLPEIMTQVNSNTYLVTIGRATGEFTRINSGLLQGNVFSNSTSGPVFVNRTAVQAHPTNASFTVIPYSPEITNVVPASGRGGVNAYAEGSNFFGVSSLKISGNGTGAELFGLAGTVVSSLGDVIFFQVPNLSTEGIYDFYLTSSGGSIVSTGLFHLLDVPFISGFTPTISTGNAVLRISGRNLYNWSNVYFNTIENSPLEIVDASGAPSYLDVRIPKYGYILNSIIVDNTVLTGTTGDFTLITTPTVSSISPSSGSWGTQVSISGSGLSFTTGVVFSGTYCSYILIGDTGIKAIIPTGSNDDVITVYTSGGSGYSPFFDVIPPLVILSGFTPTSGKRTDIISISGAYLTSVTGVFVSGVSGQISATGFLVNSGGYLTFPIPYNAVSGFISLVNQSGRTTSATKLSVLTPPIITGIFPMSGVYRTLLTVSGDGFVSGNTQFYFRGATGNLMSGDNTQIFTANFGKTIVPREIKTDTLFASGMDGITAGGLFVPLPTVGMFAPAITNTAEGNFLIVSGINAVDAALDQLLFRVGLNVTNLLDGSGQMTMDTTQAMNGTNGSTIFTGYINANQTGIGIIAFVNKFITDGSGNSSSVGYSSTVLRLSGAAPTISGFIADASGYPMSSGGYPRRYIISGNNMLGVTGVFQSHTYAPVGGWPATIISRTPRQLLIEPFHPLIEGTGKFLLYQPYGNPVTGTQSFLNAIAPVISGISPNPVLTGGLFRVNGNALYFTTGVNLVDSLGNRYSIPFSGFTSDPLFSVSWLSGQIPGDISLSNKDWTLEVLNPASGATAAIQIVNQRDLDAASNLEATALLFSSKSDFTTVI